MTIVAERGLFVRLLVQSGKFEHAQAEALVDALDASTKEPATKADFDLLRADIRSDVALVQQRLDGIDRRFDAVVDKLFVRLGGQMIAIGGLTVAALRLS